EKIDIALVGIYVELEDAYISIVESLIHSGAENGVEVNIHWVQAEDVNEDSAIVLLENVGVILVPGGFGVSGVEAKISAIKYARENNLPCLGVSLGMQLAVIEYARNVLGLEGAHGTEWYPDTKYPIVDLMPEQKDMEFLNGEMRLGLYPCKIAEDTLAKEIYKDEIIYERHRHRYEINNEYRNRLIEEGLIISGLSHHKRLVEIIENKDHPWFIGVNFHPEFKSRPIQPHPLFREFVKFVKENQ